MAVSDYSTTPASNTSISGINIAEGCSPANINNAIRQLMSDVRTFYDGMTIGQEVQAYDAGLQQIADLADPNADRILFWDDSAGAYTYLTVGTNLSISGTTLNAADQTPADGSITFAKMAGAAVITSGETISSNNNDTTIPTSAATKAYTDGLSLGVGQTWQDVGGSRTAATNYTNSTGRPIMVSVTFSQSNTDISTLLVGGVVVAQGQQSNIPGGQTLTAVVPDGATYRFNTGSNAFTRWAELR